MYLCIFVSISYTLYCAYYVRPAKLVHGMLDAAMELGATVHTHINVVSVESVEDSVAVNTKDNGVFHAKQVVYATNAWASDLLPHLKDIIIPVRNQVIYCTIVYFISYNYYYYYHSSTINPLQYTYLFHPLLLYPLYCPILLPNPIPHYPTPHRTVYR